VPITRGITGLGRLAQIDLTLRCICPTSGQIANQRWRPETVPGLGQGFELYFSFFHLMSFYGANVNDKVNAKVQMH